MILYQPSRGMLRQRPVPEESLSANRITLLAADLEAGGTQRVLSMMANHWAACGRSVRLLTPSSAASDFYVLDPRVDRVGRDLVGRSSPPGAVGSSTVDSIQAGRTTQRAG